MFSQPRQILVVEDHADSAVILYEILTRQGHRVWSAASCAEARSMFARWPEIDLLMIDLGLPDGHGCDLLRELRAVRSVPAIAVTGHAKRSDIERCQQAGFIAHLSKPLMLDQLMETLARIKEPPASSSPPTTPGGGDNGGGGRDGGQLMAG